MVNKMFFAAIITFMLFAVTDCLAQDDTAGLNRKDARGMRQGKWKQNYPDGKTRYTGNFVNDNPQGEFLHYHTNGKLKSKVNHKPDGTAEAELYDEHGRIIAKGSYKGQKKDKLWTYYNERGNVLSTEYYEKTEKSGVWKIYYDSGVVSEETTYKNDVKHGIWKRYALDGSTIFEVEYKNGKMDGPYRVFNANGSRKLNGNYKEGLKNGIWVYFNSRGYPELRETYKMGKLIKKEDFNR